MSKRKSRDLDDEPSKYSTCNNIYFLARKRAHTVDQSDESDENVMDLIDIKLLDHMKNNAPELKGALAMRNIPVTWNENDKDHLWQQAKEFDDAVKERRRNGFPKGATTFEFYVRMKGGKIDNNQIEIEGSCTMEKSIKKILKRAKLHPSDHLWGYQMYDRPQVSRDVLLGDSGLVPGDLIYISYDPTGERRVTALVQRVEYSL
jgi:hypothetical protein